MAGADYAHCEVCGAKTFYDTDIEVDPDTGKYYGCGDIASLCLTCAETYVVAVLPKSILDGTKVAAIA